MKTFFALLVSGTLLATLGCSGSSSSGTDAGSGGSIGTGGTASGGATGTGGTTGAGGTAGHAGSGGIAGPGGQHRRSGGATASGGAGGHGGVGRFRRRWWSWRHHRFRRRGWSWRHHRFRRRGRSWRHRRFRRRGWRGLLRKERLHRKPVLLQRELRPLCARSAARASRSPARMAASPPDAGACVATPALDSSCAGTSATPHYYRCVLSTLPSPCVAQGIGNVTNTFCCP